MAFLRQAWSGSARWIAFVWLVIGLVTGTQVVVGMAAVGMHHHWVTLFFTTAASYVFWALATPLALALNRRFPLTRVGEWTNLPVHLFVASVLTIAHIAWSAGLEWMFNPLAYHPAPSFGHQLITELYMQFHMGLIIYACISAVGNAIDSVRRLARREAEAARLETKLSKAQLHALRRQLEPHFLFNTLNGISGLIRENRAEDAVGMIAGLSDLLRRVFEDSGRQVVPLAEEISFLESYIDLQSMRFGERLKVSVDVPIELYGALVPQLILQPLVENAIVHGIGKLEEGGEIRLIASEFDGVLSLRVFNDAPEFSLAAPETTGVGLSNTRGRLTSLYGASSSLEFRKGERAGVETIIKIPCRTEA